MIYSFKNYTSTYLLFLERFGLEFYFEPLLKQFIIHVKKKYIYSKSSAFYNSPYNPT